MSLSTRRGVLAFFALTDLPMPQRVQFPAGGQGAGLLSIEFDTIAHLTAWMTDVFELPLTKVNTQPYARGGISATLGTATNVAWQGWDLYLSSLDQTTADASIDDETRDRLQAVIDDEDQSAGDPT